MKLKSCSKWQDNAVHENIKSSPNSMVHSLHMMNKGLLIKGVLLYFLLLAHAFPRYKEFSHLIQQHSIMHYLDLP